MKELDNFTLCQKKQEAFGGASALFDYRFQNDNGSVPQLEQAMLYCDRWEQMRQENLGLLFWGAPGNGKTFAAAAIANFLLEQEGWHVPTVKMTTFGIILGKLPGMSAQDKEWYLKDFQSCDLLILDDFGMERQTDYAREQVFNIIDGRYLTKRPLIVTTNLSLNHMKTTTDLAEKRIYDRVLEMCIPVFFSGESQRPDRAKANLEQFRSIVGK